MTEWTPAMTTSFERLTRTPLLPSRISAQLLERIAAGQFKPGQRLPTEHALAAEFGVSRNVVREAIAHLRSEGVVESRHGVGAFVTTTGMRSSFRINANALSDRRSLRSLFELRALIEIESAGLAAARATAEDMARIEAALRRMQSSEMWGDDGIEADLDFHVAVAGATANEHIQTLVRYIAGHMRNSIAETRAKSPSVAETIEETVAEHEAIFQALTDRDAEAARAAMRHHVTKGAVRLDLSGL